MALFINGMAIGLLLLIPAVLLILGLYILYLVGAFTYGFVSAARRLCEAPE